MAYLSETSCCGLWEVNELADSSSTFHALHSLYDELDGVPFVLFTEVTEYGDESDDDDRPFNYGSRLAAYITEHKLGTCVSTPERVNPNSSNTIRAWLWTVDYPQLHTWAQTH